MQISEEDNPTLLRNFIHDNKSARIISFNSGKGVARHNDITHNGKGGVQVRSRACPELVRNRIFSERSFGVWVYEHGLGRFEDNDIINNAWSGFQVEEGSAPVVIGNRLRGNRSGTESGRASAPCTRHPRSPVPNLEVCATSAPSRGCMRGRDAGGAGDPEASSQRADGLF